MSSRHDVRRHERSKSRSVEHRRSWKHDRTRSHSPKSSKHWSPSREKRETKHKKSKKKKRHSSSSSSSSDSGEEELKLLQRLETERLRLKEDKKKQKEQLKANETPEEKRARRLREKQEKERKRRERMGWDNEYQCYTNQDNPFGDSALTNTFVWTKKLAKEGVKTVSRDELEALNRQKQLENKIELEKVKQRRLEREAERAAREAEAAAAARAREAMQFHTWARQEDAFHLHQARLRSQIRIRDGRAKPIDLLAWYVSSEECVDALEMHEPYTYLNGLQTQDLEDLLEDIKVYKELENNANQAYWEDVQTIVLDELNKLRRLAAPDARRDGVHQAVADDVTQIFKGKTGAQLEALQTQIEQKISGRHDGVDVGYWESLLSQLKAHMSRARLRDRHQGNLRRKLQLLKQEQGVTLAKQEEAHRSQSPEEDRPAEPPAEASTSAAAVDELPGDAPGAGAQAEAPEGGAPGEGEGEGESDSSAGGAEEDAASAALYRAGRYSPAPLSPSALEPATLLTEPAHDAQRLAYLRAGLRAAAAHSRTRGKVSTSGPARPHEPAPLSPSALEPATLLTEPAHDAQRLAYLRAGLRAAAAHSRTRGKVSTSGPARPHEPAPLSPSALEPATLLTEPAHDAQRLAYLRAGLRAAAAHSRTRGKVSTSGPARPHEPAPLSPSALEPATLLTEPAHDAQRLAYLRAGLRAAAAHSRTRGKVSTSGPARPHEPAPLSPSALEPATLLTEPAHDAQRLAYLRAGLRAAAAHSRTRGKVSTSGPARPHEPAPLSPSALEPATLLTEPAHDAQRLAYLRAGLRAAAAHSRTRGKVSTSGPARPHEPAPLSPSALEPATLLTEPAHDAQRLAYLRAGLRAAAAHSRTRGKVSTSGPARPHEPAPLSPSALEPATLLTEPAHDAQRLAYLRAGLRAAAAHSRTRGKVSTSGPARPHEPAPLSPSALEPATLLTEPAHDAQRLAYLRAGLRAAAAHSRTRGKVSTSGPARPHEPAPLSPSALEPATLLTEPAHDAQRLAYLRAGLRAAAAHSRTRGKVSTSGPARPHEPAPLSPSALEPATLLTEPAHDAQRLAYLRAGLRAAAAHSRTRGKVSTSGPARPHEPAPLSPSALEPATLLTEPAHDAQRLAYLRAGLRAAAAHSRTRGKMEPPGGSTEALEREARRVMGANSDEVPFSVEHALPDQPCLWADKYRPRKPRYFNRVHTGFEWNKYNQTHYDMDNPPPKIVQGYKFNIFYPDLIDKNATPEFSLKACPENPDFAVLRFHAGPPYEDIAFKIVNREWEYSYKRGFRCHFHNNIFQLWFHFKRYRYRR